MKDRDGGGGFVYCTSNNSLFLPPSRSLGPMSHEELQGSPSIVDEKLRISMPSTVNYLGPISFCLFSPFALVQNLFGVREMLLCCNNGAAKFKASDHTMRMYALRRVHPNRLLHHHHRRIQSIRRRRGAFLRRRDDRLLGLSVAWLAAEHMSRVAAYRAAA